MEALHAGGHEKPYRRRKRARRITNQQLWESTWTAARFYLRLTDQQFGVLTPRLFYALMGRHSEHLQFQKSLFGIVAAAVANFSYSRPKEPLEPADFVGGKRMRDRVTKEQQVSNLRAFLMARVKKND